MEFIYILCLLSAFSMVQNAPMKPKEYSKYLMTYGYLKNDRPKPEEFKSALMHFQKTYSLPMTGKMDVKTSKQMEKPRCGKADNITVSMYTRNPWGKRTLTYKLNSFPRNGMDRITATREIARAFAVWERHIPMKFQLKREGPVDIDITFSRRIDGVGNTLAYAYYPRRGDIYFDNEPWTANTNRGTNLLTTAAHEIGHSLGLGHSQVRNALMYAYIIPYNPNLQLFQDDIRRIQRLYGRKTYQNQEVPDVTSENPIEPAAPKAPIEPIIPTTNICKTKKIDTAIFSPVDKSVYLIKDSLTWKLKDGKLEQGYPQDISEVWPGIPKNINAAYYVGNKLYYAKDLAIWEYNLQNGIKKAYLLEKQVDDIEFVDNNLYAISGKEVWAFNIQNGQLSLEYGFPKKISEFWKEGPVSVDALYFDKKHYYLFNDNYVYQFNYLRQFEQRVAMQKWLSCNE